eukprot:TRINITY_DN7695_c0_g1_i1.p1 TRINITY_DN7695_c0_g1~~TRINITY_DN7695_c0_g1_i1.p1  ORF type:complete len:109 (+),score=28.93 TRINITY_DN7695_c0_g1_i1:79-405(+)
MAARRVFLPIVISLLAAALLLRAATSFVPAPQQQQLRFLQTAAASAGTAALTSGALPALAEKTFEVDSVEAYDLKVQYAAGLVLTASAFFVGFIISQARILVENKWLN